MFGHVWVVELTLSLPTSNYYMSPLSLRARNLPPSSPAISCVFYIILPSEVKFYPQAGSTQNQFCRCWDRVFWIPADTESAFFSATKNSLKDRGESKCVTTILQVKPCQSKKRSMLTFPREWIEGDNGQLKHILCVFESFQIGSNSTLT